MEKQVESRVWQSKAAKWYVWWHHGKVSQQKSVGLVCQAIESFYFFIILFLFHKIVFIIGDFWQIKRKNAIGN